MNLKALTQQALDAWEDVFKKNKVDVRAINVLRAALASPTSQESRQVEPVAWMLEAYDIFERRTLKRLVFDKPENMQHVKVTEYYTAPPKRDPLTDEQIMEIFINNGRCEKAFARAIERAHGIRGEE